MSDKKWIGGGLPPPSIECEVLFDGINYARCFIVAHDEDRAVYRLHREEDDMSLIEYAGEVFTWECGQVSFRPVPTKDEIAEAERERTIRGIEDVLSSVVSRYQRRDSAEILYKAGCRKQGAE